MHIIVTMDSSQFPFERMYLSFPQDIPIYHGQAVFGDFGTTDGNVNNISFPLENDFAQTMPPCKHDQMQRFLEDKQCLPLFNPVPQPQIRSAAQPVTPLPSTAPRHRQDSPFSSQDASNCSSARSPRADTDLYTENMPSTPPDNVLMSSFQSMPLESFEPQSSFFLSSMGPLMGASSSCVTMADVNSGDEIQNNWKESPHMLDFNSPQRSFTLDSQASVSTFLDAMSRHPSFDQSFDSPSTPEVLAVAQEEISCPTDDLALADKITVPYPTPSARDSEYSDAEIDVASFRSDDDQDDDDDYQPTKKRAPTSARRSSRGKRDAPTRSLEKNSPKRPKTTSSSSSPPAKPIPAFPSGSKGNFSCTDCPLSFKDDTALHTHIKKQHTRPFICVFGWAGCTSTFASKNEWKRHVMSQDIARHYWVCDLGTCADTKNDNHAPHSPRSRGSGGRGKRSRRNAATGQAQTTPDLEPVGPPLPNGAIFNRKDLYTQHVRRMHAPSNLQEKTSKSSHTKKTLSSTSSAPATTTTITTTEQWDTEIKHLQSAALRERCPLPTEMRCPAPCCDTAFTGADAWDQRMEHVARHLERAALGQEDPVVFGGDADPSLMAWAARSDVAVVRPAPAGVGAAQAWVLNNPLRVAGSGSAGGSGARAEGKSRRAGMKREMASGAAMAAPLGRAASSAASAGSVVVSFGTGTSTRAPSVKSEIFVEEGDEDAEGEDE